MPAPKTSTPMPRMANGTVMIDIPVSARLPPAVPDAAALPELPPAPPAAPPPPEEPAPPPPDEPAPPPPDAEVPPPPEDELPPPPPTDAPADPEPPQTEPQLDAEEAAALHQYWMDYVAWEQSFVNYHGRRPTKEEGAQDVPPEYR